MGNKKTTTHQVTTPTNPNWVTQPIQSQLNSITDLAKLDPSSLIAPANPLQTQAGSTLADLGKTSAAGQTTAMNKLTDLINLQTQGAPQISAESLLTGLDNYQNPILQKVVDTSLADFDANAGKTRAQQTLDIANQGAFGGSGAALTRSATEDALARARATTDATLRSDAFDKAAGLSNLDAGRRQDAAATNASLKMQNRSDIAANLGALAGLYTGADANTRANAGAQDVVGGDLRAIDQQERQAPLTLAQQTGSLIGQLPLNLYKGEDTTSTSSQSGGLLSSLGTLAMLAAAPFTGGTSLLGTLAGGALGSILPATAAAGALGGGTALAGHALGDFAGFLSDRDAKENIETIGYDDKGRRWVSFNYKGDPTPRQGVIAQEVAVTDPEAVSRRPDGYLQVDYGALA